MLTTKNISRPEPTIVTAADRMAKARAAKEAKRAERAKATTTRGQPSRASESDSGAVAQTPAETRAILLQLQGMYLIGSKPYELCAKALRLLESKQ